jgi:hypothetical protein
MMAGVTGITVIAAERVYISISIHLIPPTSPVPPFTLHLPTHLLTPHSHSPAHPPPARCSPRCTSSRASALAHHPPAAAAAARLALLARFWSLPCPEIPGADALEPHTLCQRCVAQRLPSSILTDTPTHFHPKTRRGTHPSSAPPPASLEQAPREYKLTVLGGGGASSSHPSLVVSLIQHPAVGKSCLTVRCLVPQKRVHAQWP